MAKQLLIYETAVPVSAARHANACVEGLGGYAFSAGVNAVPLMAAEFLVAAPEYAIVFTLDGEEVIPAVVLGVRSDQNLYLGADGSWQAKYIPAFIRRYPFVFSSSGDGKTLTLCVDEACGGFNREGRGQRLFGDDGKPTPYVDAVLKFLQGYQAHFQRTQAFCRKLKTHGLLDPMQAQITTPAGGKMSLTGFMAVNRAKLRELPADVLSALAKTDELELLYLHLHSMRNFEGVKDRLIGSLPSGEGAGDTATAAQASPPAAETADAERKGSRERGRARREREG